MTAVPAMTSCSARAPIDQGASSAGRSAVAEIWLRNTASTPGTRAHRRRPTDRSQAFQRAERCFQVALCLTGRAGQGVPLMAGGAELNHPARCQPEAHRRRVPPLAPCCSQAPAHASSRTDPTAFMNPESPARSDQRSPPRSRLDRPKAPLLPRYSEIAIGSLTGLAPAPGSTCAVIHPVLGERRADVFGQRQVGGQPWFLTFC
jgi:hypothetical protein